MDPGKPTDEAITHPLTELRESVGQGDLRVLGGKWGRFLSDFTYLGSTLITFAALSVVTYIWLSIQLGTPMGRAATIAYDVSTGGSPLSYASELRLSFPFLWVWIGIFHIFAWLIVPVLAAATVDAMYRLHEEEKDRTEKRLRKRIRNFGRARLRRSGLELEHFVETTMDYLEKTLVLSCPRRSKGAPIA